MFILLQMIPFHYIEQKYNFHEETHIYFQTMSGLPHLYQGNTTQYQPPFITEFNEIDNHELKDNRKRVGLVWQGSNSGYYSARRNLPIEYLWDLMEFKDKVQFVILAYGGEKKSDIYSINQTERQHATERLNAIDLSDKIYDFQDAADWMNTCDLVIAVDTSYLHLAGAMNAEVWGLIRHNHDWRWPKKVAEPNEWYSSLKIFLEPIPRGWGYVMKDVKRALHEWLNNES